MRVSVFLIVLQVCWCLPIEKTVNPPPKSALDFMKQYGYLKADKTTSAALYTEEGLSETIKTVQRFGALKETGKLDNATLKLMTRPRCGNADVIQGKRSKRFALTSGWNKRHITYYIANWSSRLGEEAVARLIGKALNTWGTYGSLKFSRKTTPDADIIVSFARGAHNDPFPFDGPGYVLAHAYFPNSGSEISGDIHFDDEENWVQGSQQEVLDGGTDFYSVALHELGHSLGLAHSNDPRSVMFAYYKGDDESSVQLGQDDILAMYQLYIARPVQETTEPTTTRRTRPFNTRPPNEPTRTGPSEESTRITNKEWPTRSYTESTVPTRRTRPFNTRPPNESPRTRPPEQPTRTTNREWPTHSYTETIDRQTWETSKSTIYTRRPTNTPVYTEKTREYPSTHFPSTRTRSTYYPTREETRTTFATPSTIYPTIRRRNEEGTTSRTTYSRWYTTGLPSSGVRTTTLKSNNRFPLTTSTRITTIRDRNRHGGSVTINRRPYAPPTRYPTGSQSTTLPPEPNICKGSFDSVAYLRGEIFIFKDQYVWRLQDRNRIVPGYPVTLQQMFFHLPQTIKKIDAAYQRPDGDMILFAGDLYWVYDGTNFVENSPRNIQDYGVPSGISGVDAVQTWGRNGKTYLYKGDRFWRFNETSRTPDPGYPQHIEKWGGIPKNIDAATTWKDGKTYFFKDDLYWTFDNYWGVATSDSPRSSTKEWLGCP
ncbi:matrix metalloproteinase-25-like isoform X2 [Coccinella septempunctata]|uniref:matrix metalloproteinase-25-like isoform X2 n=1 Tax=Coccinella septempunctata TaxID=41139 RepID=UPI001D06E755|nr:matrix metalloproteinase-25-like isoform X2 [Coccinella septempunctata]